MKFSVGVGDSEPILTIDFLSAREALEMVEQAQLANARIITVVTEKGDHFTIEKLRDVAAKEAVASMRG